MEHRQIFPQAPSTVAELEALIDTRPESSGEALEQQIPRLLARRLDWMFHYTARFHPQFLTRTKNFDAPTIEVVEVQESAQRRKPGEPNFYRITRFDFDNEEMSDHRYVISEVEQLKAGESSTIIFNRIIDGMTGEMLGPDDGVIAGQIYELITRPDLHLRAQSEAAIGKITGFFKRRILGRTAVKHFKLPPDR